MTNHLARLDAIIPQAKAGATFPIHSTSDFFLAGQGKPYDVGTVAALPDPFYGWLKIISDQPLDLKILSPNKLITGKVVYAASGTGVDNALVVAQREGAPDVVETHTDANGRYNIAVDGGRWLLDVVPAPGVTRSPRHPRRRTGTPRLA
jgi:hypothetical protein